MAERKGGSRNAPRQMHLTEAHPGRFTGFFQIELPDERENPLDDPEEGISVMHHRYKGPKLRKSDFDALWRQKLREWGYTQASRRARSEELMDEAISLLKAAGVFSLIVKSDWTLEEREEISRILNAKEPWRDLDSSDGLTFYDDEHSFFRDIYGDPDV